jgi:hypothetical protein
MGRGAASERLVIGGQEFGRPVFAGQANAAAFALAKIPSWPTVAADFAVEERRELKAHCRVLGQVAATLAVDGRAAIEPGG